MFFLRFCVRLSVFAAAFLSVSLPRACMADIAQPPMVMMLPGGFIAFLFGLFFNVIPAIAVGFFAVWLFSRYRRHCGTGSKAVRETFIEIFYLCLLIFCAATLILAVLSSYDQGYTRSLALIPLLTFLSSICVGSRRYETDAFSEMCPNFPVVAMQFYITSFLLCAGLTMCVLHFKYFWDNRNVGFLVAAAMSVSPAAVFLNCKILDRFQPDSKSSNIVVATRLYVRLYALAFLALAALYALNNDFRIGAPRMIAAVVFANWLFIRYGERYGSFGKALKSVAFDVILLLIMLSCRRNIQFVATLPFKPEYAWGIYYNWAARLSVPLLISFPVFFIWTRRLAPRRIGSLCRDFGMVRRQFCLAAVVYCAIFIPMMCYPSINRFLPASGRWDIYSAIPILIAGGFMFVNCKIMDGYQSELKASNIVLASWLYFRLYAALFAIASVILGWSFSRGRIPFFPFSLRWLYRLF
ncbi:MAG: hypothetical protein LBG12_06375 [Synergistaceae bacterium]|jgi:hypothetical protein|nr:hypothetical protein [Synergistaceae bacterium]